MSASLLHRIAAVLLVLFSIGHTLGFRKPDARWGADAVVASMRTVHFDVGGFTRSYWDFYLGFGYFVTVFLLFAAVLCWQLGRRSHGAAVLSPVVTWGLAICFVGVTVLNWKYFFLVPGIFSSVITSCLILAAWLSTTNTRSTAPR